MTPLNDLGTFEQNCYYFGQNSAYYWDHAFQQCIDLGGQLAVIETYAEFQWIMQLYSANYSFIGGLYLDVTRNRYGSSTLTSAWRGGVSLLSGVGSLFNNVTITPLDNSSCYGGNYYYPAFYLTLSGNLQDIQERSTITNGGYLCKKFRAAPKPSPVGYNLGYCFPSIQSNGSCPVGWSSYTPNNTVPFCYFSFVSYIFSVDEQFRICHSSGADLIFLDDSSEYSWLYSSGQYSNNYYSNRLNVHRYRYGPTFSWSNGLSFNTTSNGYSGPGPTDWCTTDPRDDCAFESCIEAYGSGGTCWKDVSCYAYYPSQSMAAVCKRPLCGKQWN